MVLDLSFLGVLVHGNYDADFQLCMYNSIKTIHFAHFPININEDTGRFCNSPPHILTVLYVKHTYDVHVRHLLHNASANYSSVIHLYLV